jgi:5-methylcytosine-specific restriction endonuclease McrA
MDRTCLQCRGPLPEGSQKNRRYCSTRCYSAMVWQRDSEGRKRARREWWANTVEKRAAERLAAKPERFCEWCKSPLPTEAQARRQFCDVTCKNRFSVRRDRAKRTEANRRWARENPERARAWRTAYLPRQREAVRKRYAEAPEVFLNYKHLRRARMAAAGGPGVSRKDWGQVVARFGGRCAYCDALAPLAMDHVVPISRGGWHAIGNVLPACRSCNSSKSDRLLIEWRPHLKSRIHAT